MDEDDMVVATNDDEELLFAARYGEEGDVTLLLELLQANPNAVDCADELGRTPMHMAAANGHRHVVSLLVEHKARPNVVNAEGNSALHYAAMNNRTNVVPLLLSSGWSVGLRNNSGKTALQEIGEKEFDELEVMLLNADDTLQMPTGGVLVVDNEVEEGVREEEKENRTTVVEVGPPVTTSLVGTCTLDDVE